MTSQSKPQRAVFVVWFVIVALVLSVSSTLVRAQDGDEELTFDELQEQRELAAQQLADAAASIDATTASIEEIATALEEVAVVASIHEIRLGEATDRYNFAVGRFNQAEESHAEVVAEIEELRVLVVDLALAQFTGESGREVIELALSTDPGQSSRLAHLFRIQTSNAQDAMDRLSVLELEAAELLDERTAASALAEESLLEVQRRASQLDTSIGQQEELLQAAELRLSTSEADAEAAAALIEETEERLINYVRGVGAPAPVDRADIVTLSFFEGSESRAFFQIQVHKDIEEQTRGLYQLAFSQGINLGGWGFRTTDRQIELRRAHCGDTDFDIWLKPANECSPPTARPGYSKHEQGRAIDFQWNGGSIGSRSGEPFQWLAANAPQFGFVNLPSEPWHWSDGTATTFDPTVPLPDFAEVEIVEAEPDGEIAELLSVPLGEDEDAEAGEEVAVEVEIDPDAIESDVDGEILPEVLGEVAVAEESTPELPVAGELEIEVAESDDVSPAEPAAESAAEADQADDS